MKIANYKTAKVGWVLDYNESKIESNTAARIGGNVAGNKEAVERIFNHFAFQRESSGLKNRFIHLKLSLSPLDNNISSKNFRQIAEKVLEGLDLKNNPFIIYRHYDTEHPHLHIVISRVTFDGNLIRDSFDGLRIKRIEEKLDKEFRLTPSSGRILSPMGIRMPQKWERERSEKTGAKSVRNYIQCGIIESINDNPTLTIFVKRLERRGIKIWRREINRESKVYHGLSCSLDPNMLKIKFQDKSPFGLAGGIEENEIDKFASQVPVKTDHKFFGKIIAKLVTNVKGIPEFCMGGTMPDDALKPYSFRAANLGPFFQYNSIMSQLSGIEPDTLEYITLRAKKPIQQDYVRKPLTENEHESSKLILAAEIKSVTRVSEALKDGIKLSEIERMDRACTEAEKNFIRMVVEANADLAEKRGHLTGREVDVFSKLILQLRNFTNEKPNPSTIKSIRLISEKNWTELQSMLNEIKDTNVRENAPSPNIMYLGIPTALSFTMMDYQLWYNSDRIDQVEDANSAERHRVQKDTMALLKALQSFDEEKVWEILTSGEPDVAKIPLEHIGKVNDPALIRLLNKLSIEMDAPPENVTIKKTAGPDIRNTNTQEQQLSKENGPELS
jgi:hypothetical protein